AECNIHRHATIFRGLFEVVQVSAVARLGPWFYSAVGKRQAFVGNNEIHVEVDRIDEPLTPRTSAERTIEGKELGFRILVADAAFFALKRLAEAELPSG